MINKRKKGSVRVRAGSEHKSAAPGVRSRRPEPRYNGTGSRLPRSDTANTDGNPSRRTSSRYGGNDRFGRSVTRDGGAGYGRQQGARRTDQGGVYYIRNERDSGETAQTPRRRPMTEADRRRRLEAIRRRYERRVRRIRAAVILAAAAAVTVIVVFMTPLFDIKQISLEGNSTVTKEQIQDKVGSLIGSNLFASTNGKIRAMVMEIPMIKDVEVGKRLFPPSVSLRITESAPAAYMLSSNRTVVVDSTLRVLDDSGGISTDGLPSISGISVSSYELNEQIVSDTAEKDDALKDMLSVFESTGLLRDITYISLDDISEITFNYANRLECKCGSALELERKIRMFAETISSSSMSNSMGTMDLSTPGYAIYQP